MSCIYLGKALDRKTEGGADLYGCQIHEKCLLTNSDRQHPACDTCPNRLNKDDPEFAKKWEDSLIVYDRRMQPTTCLRGHLGGRAVFLVCGGPSINDLPLERFQDRGMWGMAVNNVAGHARLRPRAFCCTDPLSKFTHSVWNDPDIMKFIPHTKTRGHRSSLREKLPDGTFKKMELNSMHMPNIWPVRRRSWMVPDETFFLDDSAPSGNFDAGKRKTGEPKTVCTMLFGMRILRHLGAGTVFIIGADFYMTPEKGYSFEQSRTEGECGANNRQFTIINQWLTKMNRDGVFRKFGIQFFNCYQNSGLRAFPYVPFETACKIVTKGIEKEPDLKEWYKK